MVEFVSDPLAVVFAAIPEFAGNTFVVVTDSDRVPTAVLYLVGFVYQTIPSAEFLLEH